MGGGEVEAGQAERGALAIGDAGDRVEVAAERERRGGVRSFGRLVVDDQRAESESLGESEPGGEAGELAVVVADDERDGARKAVEPDVDGVLDFRREAGGGVEEIAGDDEVVGAFAFGQRGERVEVALGVALGHGEAAGAESGRLPEVDIRCDEGAEGGQEEGAIGQEAERRVGEGEVHGMRERRGRRGAKRLFRGRRFWFWLRRRSRRVRGGPEPTTMSEIFHSNYPSIEHLRAKAKRRMPGFAFDYLEGGCFSEVNLRRNTDEIRQVQLRPVYLRDYAGSSLKTEIFGHTYDAPFGIPPIGLQGLMWPKSTEILAKAAYEANIPFVLSTVGTASIETVAELTQGRSWFQLYHPAEDELRDKLLDRVKAAGFPVLVILADTPTFAYRPKEIRNGLSIPPRMTLRNVFQMMTHPTWSFSQLAAGAPEFATMKPYIPKGLNMKHLGLFMNRTFSGRLNPAKIAAIRERWQGKLVVKGIVNEEDAEKALELGVDGFIVSNHGGRQLDAGQSTIQPLAGLAAKFKGRTTVMIDSGLRSGPDVACALASGADFTFLGRSFMYGVGALGKDGGAHVITMLKRQLTQVMEQVGCEKVTDLPNHLVR